MLTVVCILKILVSLASLGLILRSMCGRSSQALVSTQEENCWTAGVWALKTEMSTHLGSPWSSLILHYLGTVTPLMSCLTSASPCLALPSFPTLSRFMSRSPYSASSSFLLLVLCSVVSCPSFPLLLSSADANLSSCFSPSISEAKVHAPSSCFSSIH